VPHAVDIVRQRIERVAHGVPQGIELFAVDTSPNESHEGFAARLLDEAEREEAGRFVKPDDRSGFVFRRAARHLLRAELGIGAETLSYDRNGCPLGGDEWPGISFSSDDGCALLAFSRVFVLGVDIEHLRPVDDLDGVARDAFSLAERRLLDEASAASRAQRFLEIWTLKEAWLKGMGPGLSGDAAQYCVVAAAARQTSEGWRMAHLAVRPGYVAALAWRRAT
jgi:4'-phosphopantetheinyl transferase